MAKQERSAGFVIFRAAASGPRRYLLLDYGGHWDFAKGHVEAGEDDLTTARRELEEETGITEIQQVPNFCHEISYFFKDRRRELVKKTVVFFLAETHATEVRLSREHVGSAYLPFEAATKRLSFPNARELLRLAHEQLTTQANEAGQVSSAPDAM